MNSIAIWWIKKNSEVFGKPKIHLDVNVWLAEKDKRQYLEFGLRIENYAAIEDLLIFVPYVLEKQHFKDKTSILLDRTGLLNALFNEFITVETSGEKLTKISFREEDKKNKNFYLCGLNENDISLEQCSDKGSILKITFKYIPDKNDIKRIYFRFRLNKIENIFKSVKENYFYLDGFFKKIGFVEININSIRKLPSEVAERISDVNFESMNLFVMADINTNMIFESNPVKGSRILESHIWDEYIKLEENSGSKINTDKVIAYHWQKEEEFRDYNLFAKISFFYKKVRFIIAVISMVILLGTIGGIIGNYITIKWLHNFEASKTSTIIISSPGKDSK